MDDSDGTRVKNIVLKMWIDLVKCRHPLKSKLHNNLLHFNLEKLIDNFIKYF